MPSPMRGKVKIHQFYKSKKNKIIVEVIGQSSRGGKWKARILTERDGVYHGSHTFAVRTLYKEYELINKKDIIYGTNQ